MGSALTLGAGALSGQNSQARRNTNPNTIYANTLAQNPYAVYNDPYAGQSSTQRALAAPFNYTFGGSVSQNQASSFIDPNQAGYLNSLWGGGNQLMQQQAGIGQAAQGFAGNLFNQGQQGMNMLGMGGQAMQPYMGPGFAQQQIGALANQSQDFLGRSLGQIGAQGVGSGGYGGTRQGVAEGQAIGDAQRSFDSAASGLLQNDLMRQQQAASTFGQQNMAGGMGLLGGMSPLYNQGMAPFSAQWSPFQNQAGLLGAPAILDQQTGSTVETKGVFGSINPFS